jgi:hypothetical protein
MNEFRLVLFNGTLINLNHVMHIGWREDSTDSTGQKHKVTVTYTDGNTQTWSLTTKQGALDAIKKIYTDSRVYLIDESP